MKLSSVLLAGSLVANAALLVAFVLVPSDLPPVSLGPAVTGLANATSTRVLAPPSAAVTTSSPDAVKSWGLLGTSDLPAVIARLRAAGFPSSVLRAIINQPFDLRRQQLNHDEVTQPYWKSRSGSAADPKTVAALAELDRERTDMTKQLLGADDPAGDDSDATKASRMRLYGDLSAGKVAQLTAIQRDYSEQFSQIGGQTGGAPALSNDEKVALMNNAVVAQKEMHDAIAKLLTPDELLDYDMRNSETSVRLRQALTGFNATEAEYRALFPLYQAVDEQFPPTPFSIDGSQAAARRAADEQNQEQINALLGPDRYADYQQASQPQYQQLNALVARLDLPLSAATQVASVQQDIQQRVAAVRSDRKLSADARTTQLAALAQDASTRIAATLGDRGLEGYKQNGGQWLNQLQPRPPANSKSP